MSLTPTEIKNVLWRHGRLEYLLRPEQQKLRDLLEKAPTDLAVFNIARRFGKSTTCVVFCNEQALRKTQRILYSTAFLSDLENFLCPIFEWCLQDCPDSLRPVWKASKKEYHYKNGSVIKLIGLDKNPNALRGNNIDILVVDEAGFVTKLAQLYRSVIVPATMKRKFKLIFPSTPPESPEHFWAAELVPKAQDRNSYIHLTIDDISDLPSEERKRLLDEVGGEHSSTAQREFFGCIQVDSTRSVAPSFTKDHVQALEFNPDHIKWQLFGDTGAVDKTVFLEAGYSHEIGKTIFRSELTFPTGTPTSIIVQGVKDKWGNGLSLTLDATEQLRIDYSSLGLPASFPKKDDFGAGLLLLNNELHNHRFVILPECKLFIRTLEGGLLTPNRNDYTRTESLGHCDYAATAIYALRGVDKQTDLRPQQDPNKVWTPPHLVNPHLQNLRKLGY